MESMLRKDDMAKKISSKRDFIDLFDWQVHRI